MSCHLIVVGAGNAGRRAAAELSAAGIDDFATVDRPGRDVVSSVFDEATDTWTLRTADDGPLQADVVIATQAPAPWIPKLLGHNDFGGASFHAAQWEPAFEPTGLRIAVIGVDTTAAYHLRRLTGSAASVSVFAHPPRRVVARIAPATRRWLGRPTRPDERPRITVVRSAIDALTRSGVRTRDGAEHSVDAIVYGTGFRAPGANLVGSRGLTIQRAWRDGMEPLHGVAVHGFPNYFFMTGPDVVADARYVTDCVRAMSRSGSSRIEARSSNLHIFNERVYLGPTQPHPVTTAFDLSATAADLDATYDGAATLTIGGTGHPVRVRLSGRLDPIDGHYHWQGTVFGPGGNPLPTDALKQARKGATLTVGERSATARIMEQTPWGTHAVAGVGTPPFATTIT